MSAIEKIFNQMLHDVIRACEQVIENETINKCSTKDLSTVIANMQGLLDGQGTSKHFFPRINNVIVCFKAELFSRQTAGVN